MQGKLDFLHSLPLFQLLTPPELVDLARICQLYSFQRGSVLTYQNDVIDQLFIVQQGRLEAYHVQQGVIDRARSRTIEAGQYIGEKWIVETSNSDVTLRAATDGKMYVIQQQNFLAFLESHPNCILDLPDTLWQTLDSTRATPVEEEFVAGMQLMTGERIELKLRRSWWILLFEMVLPLFLLIIFPLLGWLLAVGMSWAWRGPLIISGVLGLLLAFAIGFFRYWDWSNDFIAVTNRFVISRDFSLRNFRQRIIRIPIDQVQSIKVIKPTFIQTLVGVGSIEVTTASEKGITFDDIYNPNQIEVVLQGARRREQELETSRQRAAVRQSLEQHFQVPAQISQVAEPQDGNAGFGGSKKIKRLGDRFEAGEVITYGRHWIVLLRKTWYAILLALGALLGGAFLFFFFPDESVRLLVGVGMAVIFLISLVLLYLGYENWNNDLFQITAEQIIDIDRTSLGLTESRKVAPIVNVQNVRMEQPGILATILGYGNVYVDTASGQAQIIFENISNPTQVQADIFARRGILLERHRAREAVNRRQEFALLLDQYHQLTEQNKIPRRTPSPDEGLEK